jgi:N-acetylglutamate synthase-like GNAT family acetyltransferase
MTYQLAIVATEQDRDVYHAIRRAELFDAKGRNNYLADHPDETRPDHYQLLLKWNGSGVATTRFDILRAGVAAIRLVAVTRTQQGRGHGRVLAELTEAFARGKGVSKLVVNAAPDAVGYYERLGFGPEDWDPAELVGISADSVQMAKYLG